MNLIAYLPVIAVLLLGGCSTAAPSVPAPSGAARAEQMLDFSVPSANELSQRGVAFLVFCANIVDALSNQSDDIPTLAGIIEYRVTQSKEFADYVDLVARAVSGTRRKDGKIPALSFYETKEIARESIRERLRAKLPSDILESKMRHKQAGATQR